MAPHDVRQLDLPRIRRALGEQAWAYDDPGAYDAGVLHALQAVQRALDTGRRPVRPRVTSAV